MAPVMYVLFLSSSFVFLCCYAESAFNHFKIFYLKIENKSVELCCMLATHTACKILNEIYKKFRSLEK